MVKHIMPVTPSFFGIPNEWFTLALVDIEEETNTATLVYIQSAQQHKGYFRALLKAIEDRGYTVKVYSPIPRTVAIIERLGYRQFDVATWIKEGS
jgi:hypothetical protein